MFEGSSRFRRLVHTGVVLAATVVTPAPAQVAPPTPAPQMAPRHPLAGTSEFILGIDFSRKDTGGFGSDARRVPITYTFSDGSQFVGRFRSAGLKHVDCDVIHGLDRLRAQVIAKDKDSNPKGLDVVSAINVTTAQGQFAGNGKCNAPAVTAQKPVKPDKDENPNSELLKISREELQKIGQKNVPQLIP